MIKYTVEVSLEDFKAWSGGLDRLERIIELDKVEEAESIIMDMLECYEEVTDTTVNDLLWFEMDNYIEGWEREQEEEEKEIMYTDTLLYNPRFTGYVSGDMFILKDCKTEEIHNCTIKVDRDGDRYFKYEGRTYFIKCLHEF